MEFELNEAGHAEDDDALTISLDDAYEIIARARASELSGSTCDFRLRQTHLEELAWVVGSLSRTEQIDLLALMCLNDYCADDWPAIRRGAACVRHDRAIELFLTMPQLAADLLEAGLSTLGYGPSDGLEEPSQRDVDIETARFLRACGSLN